MESSAKRQKTKGKEIIMEEEDEDPVPSPARSDPAAEIACGICLSDVGQSIRGRIDSCEHYFCFVCIMEWARVETRCPLCKQRFRSIRRPIVPGIFDHERVVDMPERNQVYHPLGNESATLSDPYENIICSECHTGADEEFMLLCDLCDSASHTYCVGLGATVPEGDWYCGDCRQIIEEHSRTQTDSDAGNQDSYDSLREGRASQTAVPAFQMPSRDSETQEQASQTPVQASHAAVPVSQMPAWESQTRVKEESQTPVPESQVPVSIFEIVSDGPDFNSSQGFSSERVLEQQNVPQRRRDTTQRDSQGRVSYIRETELPTEARGEQHVRTLRQCRNLQDRIRQIRENWNTLRSGSLTFSSSFTNSSNRDYNNKRKNRVNTPISREPEPISSVGREQSADVSASSKISHNSRLHDVDKAWKMMKFAKAIEGTKNKGVLNHSSNLSPKGSNKSKDISNNNYNCLDSKSYSAPRGMAGHATFNLGNKQPECPVHDKAYIEKKMDVVKHFHKEPIEVPRGDIMGSSSLKLGGVSSKESIRCQKKPTPHQVDDESLRVCKGWDAQNCRGSAACSLSGQSSLPAMDPIVSSCAIVNSHNVKHGAVIVKHFHIGPIEVPRGDIMESSSHKLGGVSSKGSLLCQKKPTSQQVVDDGSLSVSKRWDALNSRGSAPCSLSGRSSLPAMDPIISSCSIVNSHNTKHGALSSVDKSFNTRNNNMNSSAKDEVQSLVKLNLKLQSKDQQLDVDTFREVARVATHTILAACGLEHSKSTARTISTPKCKHPEEFRQLRKSNLMPNSCRECFYSYAKDVVNCIFTEKIGPRNIELCKSNSRR